MPDRFYAMTQLTKLQGAPWQRQTETVTCYNQFIRDNHISLQYIKKPFTIIYHFLFE